MLKKLQRNKIQTSFVLPDGIGAFVGAGGAGVLIFQSFNSHQQLFNHGAGYQRTGKTFKIVKELIYETFFLNFTQTAQKCKENITWPPMDTIFYLLILILYFTSELLSRVTRKDRFESKRKTCTVLFIIKI